MKKTMVTRKKFCLPVVLLLVFLAWPMFGLAKISYEAEKITANYKKISLSQLFWEVQKNTDFVFVYSTEDLNYTTSKEINIRNASIEDFMDAVLQDTHLTYTIKDNVVVIKKAEKAKTVTVSQRNKQPNVQVPSTVQQARIVTGVVENMFGEPLPGAFVVEHGTTNVVVADVDGKFSIELTEEPAALVVSFVGYMRYEQEVSTASYYRIVLEQEIKKLEEVVITGYQTLSKERVTGSFVVVSNEQMDKQVGDRSLMEKFRGLIPGLLVSSGDNINIRGKSSLYANQSPIIVVDGFPIESSLSSINPNDVESITVLRDAAAASIWGVRASNGVIIVTTKSRQTARDAQIEFSSSLRISDMPNVASLRLANSEQYIDYELETLNKNWVDFSKPDEGFSKVAEIFKKAKNNEITQVQAEQLYDQLRANDSRSQKDLFFRKSLVQQYNISVSKSSGTNTFYSSVNLVDNKSSSIGSESTYMRFLLKNTTQLLPGITFSTSVSGLFSKGRSNGVSAYDFMTQIPYEMFTDASGNYLPRNICLPGFSLARNKELMGMGYYDWTSNLKQDMDNKDFNSTLFSPRINLGLNIKIIEGLTFDSKFQYELNSSGNDNFYNENTQTVRHLVNMYTIIRNGEPVYQIPRGSIYDLSESSQKSWYVRNQLTFVRSFGDGKHKMNAIAGTEVNSSKYNYRTDRYHNYNKEKLTYTLIDEDTYSRSLATYTGGSSYYTNSRSAFSEVENRYLSYYANASYTFADKYSVSASARIDESNLFGAHTNDRKTPLYSFGASWDITKESFFHVSSINYLRLRATSGTNGNIDKKTSKELIAKTGTSSYTQEGTLIIEYPKNDKLRWETTRIHNVGLDFSAFNNRLSFNVDYYFRKSYDLLGQVPSDPTTGFVSVYKNTAEVENTGVDLMINGDIFRGDFTWNSGLNFSFNKNKVTKVFTPIQSVDTYLRGGMGNEIEGLPIDYMYSYQWAGLSAEGEPRIYDDKGEYVSWQESDLNHIEWLTYSGSTSPRYYGSLINTFSYKGFTLFAVITYKMGYVMRLPTAWIGAFGGGVMADVDKRWRVPGDEDKVYLPKVYDSSVSKYERKEFVAKSDLRVQSAANIRFSTVSLTYNFPQQWLGRYIKGAQVMLQASDLGFWAKNSENYDPEKVSLSSGSLASMENPPVYTFGINLKF